MSFPRYVRDWIAGLDIGVQFEESGVIYPLQSRRAREAKNIAPAIRWKSIEDARSDLLAQVERIASSIRAEIIGTRDAALIEVYRNKYEAALSGDRALLEAEAAARGLTSEQLSAFIIQKAESWKEFGQAIEVARAKHKAAILSSDLKECESYNIDAWWPSI